MTNRAPKWESQRRAATNLILARMGELHLTQAALCSQVSAIEEQPLSSNSAWWWINRPDRLKPARICSIEQVLDLPPGTLIELLGGPTRAAVIRGEAVIRGLVR
jgi:hypothetical protein